MDVRADGTVVSFLGLVGAALRRDLQVQTLINSPSNPVANGSMKMVVLP
jgi:hypothetical protein